MRFLQRSSIDKTILVISDLHLSAGPMVHGKRNPLEDFHSDQELVEFLDYYSSNEYGSRPVEIVINGDFLDFLSVPFVNYFDDEYWSEKASLERLKMIMDAHKEVMEGIEKFLRSKNKKITYIIGNHDAEFVLPGLRDVFLGYFSPEVRSKIQFNAESNDYIPHPEIMIRHGHEYEKAHHFDLHQSVITSTKGERYFLPPWGSYYVTRVVNKYKEERSFINQIRPIKHFILHGLIFDSLFTLRFIFANIYYFIMVRFLYVFKQKSGIKNILNQFLSDLEIFADFESQVARFFRKNPQYQILLTGHNHEATLINFPGGKTYINTGTWTKMFNLDFAKKQDGTKLTYAQIDIKNASVKDGELVAYLHLWRGGGNLPFEEL